MKIATGNYLFFTANMILGARSLRLHVNSRALPITSNAQRVERKSKGASLCKAIGRSETIATHLHNMWSQIFNDATPMTKIDVCCTNRKNKPKKEDASRLPGFHFSKSMIS